MIVKQGNKYTVKSEDGSKHMGTYSTHEAAVKRLQEIEYFKHAKLTHESGHPSYRRHGGQRGY